jgi:hypothetical protein
MIQINETNFKMLCAKNYDSVDINSFNEDISRIYRVRKLIRKYIENDDINERLLLNHIIILFNGFGDFTINILYYIFDKNEYKYINSFLLFLNRLPDDKFVTGIDLILSTRLGKL